MNLNQICYVCTVISIVLLAVVINLFVKGHEFVGILAAIIDAFFVFCTFEALIVRIQGYE